jgi:hypothetical protein
MERADAFGNRVPDAGPALSRLAILFAAQRYGKQQPVETEIRLVTEEWRRLQPALWKNWVKEFVNRGEPRGKSHPMQVKDQPDREGQ